MAKILVAEDERDIRDLIVFTLKYAGHEVIAVGNGELAVQEALASQPDLIMLDVRMPKMTGLEACRVLKSTDTLQHIPVVFLSAKGNDQDEGDGAMAGAIDFIMKPFAPDDLARRVGEILQKIGVA